jgi:hypothetical protein
MENEFQKEYRKLDQRMKALAESSEKGVYLPNPEPPAPVNYIFICMEPSLGGWAKSVEDARSKVSKGFRNFLAGIEPMLLHFSARRFLCDKGRRYHITDFSKEAMLVRDAGKAKKERYDKWFPLLREEIKLLAKPGARIVAVGKAAAEHLHRQGLPPDITVIHYSPLAASARNACLKQGARG